MSAPWKSINPWWQEFREWQESYNQAVHGPLPAGQYLSTQSFRTGGVNNHAAPICQMCAVAAVPGISVSRDSSPATEEVEPWVIRPLPIPSPEETASEPPTGTFTVHLDRSMIDMLRVATFWWQDSGPDEYIRYARTRMRDAFLSQIGASGYDLDRPSPDWMKN